MYTYNPSLQPSRNTFDSVSTSASSMPPKGSGKKEVKVSGMAKRKKRKAVENEDCVIVAETVSAPQQTGVRCYTKIVG